MHIEYKYSKNSNINGINIFVNITGYLKIYANNGNNHFRWKGSWLNTQIVFEIEE